MFQARWMIVVSLAAMLGLTACTASQQEVKPDETAKPPPPPAEKAPAELFADAVKSFEAGKLEEAKALFTRVAAKVPTSAQPHFNLGVVAEKLGDVPGAEAAYQQAAKLDPKHKPTLLNLGRVLRLQDKFTEAIALYEEALKDPANEFDVELNNNLTVAYRLAKQYDRAEVTAQKVLARTRDNADAYKNLSLIYFDQGKYRLAEFISANARKLDDKDPGVYNNLGLIYLKLDERRMALGQFKRAVELNKDFAPSLYNIGAIALGYRDYEGAEKVLARSTQLDPNSYEGFLAYAYALDGQKGRDPKKGLKAGEMFEKVLAIKSTQSDAVCGAAWAYAAEKTGWSKALTFFERCKAQPGLTNQEVQLIDNKVKGILAMQKSGAAQPAAAEQAKPKAPTAAGGSLLDKVSEDDAKEPAEGTPAPAGGPAPAPAPTPKAEGAAPPAAPK